MKDKRDQLLSACPAVATVCPGCRTLRVVTRVSLVRQSLSAKMRPDPKIPARAGANHRGQVPGLVGAAILQQARVSWGSGRASPLGAWCRSFLVGARTYQISNCRRPTASSKGRSNARRSARSSAGIVRRSPMAGVAVGTYMIPYRLADASPAQVCDLGRRRGLAP
jgi:hypothetical protein